MDTSSRDLHGRQKMLENPLLPQEKKDAVPETLVPGDCDSQSEDGGMVLCHSE